MKDRYVYPAIFTIDFDGISVEFPDLPGCLTCGNDEAEAVNMAKDALQLHLYGMEQDGDPIPEPSKITDLKLENNQCIVLVEAWMPLIREELENRAVKKTLTIPKWLNDLAEKSQVNFSHILQVALKRNLGLDEPPAGRTIIPREYAFKGVRSPVGSLTGAQLAQHARSGKLVERTTSKTAADTIAQTAAKSAARTTGKSRGENRR